MLFCLLVALALSYDLSEPYLITQELIDEVNSKTDLWVAGVNPRFAGKKFSEVKGMLGALLTSAPHIPATVLSPPKGGLPDKFDTYEQWPACKHDIRDQGHCGSCWAFSGAETLTDRFCIVSGGSSNDVLSPQDMVSCESDEYACQGGYLSREWQYMEKTGIVTDACFPYKSAGGAVPACPNKCENSEDWTASKHKATSGSTQMFTDATSAMTNMNTKGSIQAGFTVYQDFFAYTSGVYHHVSGGVAGGHAVKAQGWGVDSGTDYWNVANSWATSWGMDGYFWIKRGTNECGFESQMYTADPAV